MKLERTVRRKKVRKDENDMEDCLMPCFEQNLLLGLLPMSLTAD